MKHYKFSVRGVTLIELMVVVVIVGILAAVAYPSYRRYAIQTRRSDAQIALTHFAALQEKFFSRCNYYARTPTGGGAGCGSGVGNVDTMLNYPSSNSPDGEYSLQLAAGNTQGACSGGSASYACGFTVYAIPVSGRSQVGDGTFRIDASGIKQWAKNGTSANYATASYNYKWTDK